MPMCQDQAVDSVNRAGFDVVRVPDGRIAPLDLLVERGGALVRVTSLPTTWVSQKDVPTVSSYPAANLATVRTAELKGRFGLSALQHVLGHVRLGAGGGRDASLSFEAKDCIISGCDLLETATWIREGDFVDETDLTLIEPDDRAWVIIEVLKSARLDIHIGSGGNVSAEVAAEDLTKTISAELSGSRTTRQGTTVEHHGDKLLTFGFKSAELTFNGVWRVGLPEKAGRKFFGADERGTDLNPIRPGSRVNLAFAG